ncbi:hypothetical protein OF83DRAFT_623866 [Amylostereum chailletii]|nr:hypothetical protein OF83DRAFT_623866 [Amylostereum chailletii]
MGRYRYCGSVPTSYRRTGCSHSKSCEWMDGCCRCADLQRWCCTLRLRLCLRRDNELTIHTTARQDPFSKFTILLTSTNIYYKVALCRVTGSSTPSSALRPFTAPRKPSSILRPPITRLAGTSSPKATMARSPRFIRSRLALATTPLVWQRATPRLLARSTPSAGLAWSRMEGHLQLPLTASLLTE